MLVLSRKKNQVLRLSGGIEIRVLAAHGGRVRLGLIAPREIHIIRGEIEHLPPRAKTAKDVAAAEA